MAKPSQPLKMNVQSIYSRPSNSVMFGQAYLSTRSLTQGLDVINMEPNQPGVRTNVINSYLSNTGAQNLPVLAFSQSQSTSVGTQASGSSVGVGTDLSVTTHNAASLQNSGDASALSPKIYSAIKDSITQALIQQTSDSSSESPSSNINALIRDQSIPGSVVNAAGAQINSFVNVLVNAVQAQTDLTAPSIVSNPTLSEMNSSVSSDITLGKSNLASNLDNTSLTSDAEQVGGHNQSRAMDVTQSTSGSNNQSSGVNDSSQSSSQADSGTSSTASGWVVSRVYTSLQSMIENLAVNQAQNLQGSEQGGIVPTSAALDSLIQSANSLFTSMGLSTNVTASTLQTALEQIQRNLMSAPAQGQWVSVIA
jgi:hypothetical protein